MHMRRMSTTMRLEDEVKIELDRFQGLVQHETGERLTQSQLLHRLLRFAQQREAEFFNADEDAWRPPTRGEMEMLFSKAGYFGPTDASKIDQALYGESEP